MHPDETTLRELPKRDLNNGLCQSLKTHIDSYYNVYIVQFIGEYIRYVVDQEAEQNFKHRAFMREKM